jgi:beta-lactamase class A
MPSRRSFAKAAAATLFTLHVSSGLKTARAAAKTLEGLAGELTRIEAAIGGRLGVAVLDTETGGRASHRADERFPMCSTFKLLAAAAVLARVDSGKEHLDRRVQFEDGDIVPNSPITKDHAGESGMSLEGLCAAAITVSDNTAGNLLLASLGGPAGLTAYARSLGDEMTRLDRIEPDLNEAIPGDPRDTTTPAAMLADLHVLCLGAALSEKSRDQLTSWMLGNKTGGNRLRAGLPEGWRVGDKTGAGERGTTNDVGIIWPPERAPVLIAAYLTETAAPGPDRNAALAAVGRAIASALHR